MMKPGLILIAIFALSTLTGCYYSITTNNTPVCATNKPAPAAANRPAINAPRFTPGEYTKIVIGEGVHRPGPHATEPTRLDLATRGLVFGNPGIGLDC